jgi:hypothetical protein
MTSVRFLPVAAIAVFGLGLGGCANEAAQQAAYAQRAFVGMPKEVLLSCAGVPEREATVDNLQYFTYSSERLVTVPSAYGGWGGPWGGPWGWRHPWWGAGFDYPYANDIQTRSCKATFTLRNGVVEKVVYGGATEDGSARLGQCYTIVQNCLAAVPQQSRPAP